MSTSQPLWTVNTKKNSATAFITSFHCTWQPACEVEPTGKDHSMTECYWGPQTKEHKCEFLSRPLFVTVFVLYLWAKSSETGRHKRGEKRKEKCEKPKLRLSPFCVATKLKSGRQENVSILDSTEINSGVELTPILEGMWTKKTIIKCCNCRQWFFVTAVFTWMCSLKHNMEKTTFSHFAGPAFFRLSCRGTL